VALRPAWECPAGRSIASPATARGRRIGTCVRRGTENDHRAGRAAPIDQRWKGACRRLARRCYLPHPLRPAGAFDQSRRSSVEGRRWRPFSPCMSLQAAVKLRHFRLAAARQCATRHPIVGRVCQRLRQFSRRCALTRAALRRCSSFDAKIIRQTDAQDARAAPSEAHVRHWCALITVPLPCSRLSLAQLFPGQWSFVFLTKFEGRQLRLSRICLVAGRLLSP
jgi:hypothetical protein